MKRARLLTRFFALSVDLSILSLFSGMALLATIMGFSIGSETFSLVTFFRVLLVFLFVTAFIFLFYFTYLNMGGGATPGKQLFGIKVINRSGMGMGMELGLFKAFIRSTGYMMSALIFGGGFLMALFFKGRTLHDIIAGTQVVEEER